jgi:hypothetical protein
LELQLEGKKIRPASKSDDSVLVQSAEVEAGAAELGSIEPNSVRRHSVSDHMLEWPNRTSNANFRTFTR